MDLNGETLRWILGHGVSLLIGTVVLLLVYRVGISAIHRLVPTVINAQAAHLPSGSSSDDEVGKRIGTIEDLLLKLLRMGVLAGFGVMVLAVFELWAVLTPSACPRGHRVRHPGRRPGLRDGVPDPHRGPVLQGRLHRRQRAPGIEGVVEEIGLRRTMLRDGIGSSHAVSNGFIRLSSNQTRLFSMAVVDFHVLHAGDLDAALATSARVADEMRADAAWSDRFLADAGTDVWVTGIGMDGASIRLQQRVPTGAQGAVASELRRRLASAMVAVSIGTGRWDTPLPIVSEPPA